MNYLLEKLDKVAYDYMEMFRDFLKDYPDFEEGTVKAINWTKQNLKKRDRITLWLKWIRLHHYCSLSNDHNVESVMRGRKEYMKEAISIPGDPVDNYKKIVHESAKKYRGLAEREKLRMGLEKDIAWGNNVAYYPLGNYERTMEHLLSLPIPEIQNALWKDQSINELIHQFIAYEREWKEKTKNLLSAHPGDKPIITFGDGWAWWLLDRGYCPEEAKAMGHCGNVNGQSRPDERILSLRQNGQQGKLIPHLTFILNTKSKSLGEMKGRGNDKPAAKYHPYILKLLESEYVNRIVGGGYKPENNFNLNDLTPEQQDQLADVKPKMASFTTRYKKFGVDDKLIKDILNKFHYGGESWVQWSEEYKGFITDDAETPLGFVRWAEIPGMNNVFGYAYSPEHDEREYTDERALTVLQSLTPKIFNLAAEALAERASSPLFKEGKLNTPQALLNFLKSAPKLKTEKNWIAEAYGFGKEQGSLDGLVELLRPDIENLMTQTSTFGTHLVWGPASSISDIEEDVLAEAESLLGENDSYRYRSIFEIMPIEAAVTFADDKIPFPEMGDLGRRFDISGFNADKIQKAVDPEWYDAFQVNSYVYQLFAKEKGEGEFPATITSSMEKVAYDYKEMFKGLLKDFQQKLPQLADEVDSNIAWAKQHLKKRDRITWYLRYVRLWLYDQHSWHQGMEALKKKYQEELNRLGWFHRALEIHPYSLRFDLDHFLSLPIPEIQNTVWEKQTPTRLLNAFRAIEEVWKEKNKGGLTPHPGDKPIITFGDGWAWWLLDRGYCPEEAKAMGHCGNVNGQWNSNERILSLRKEVQLGGNKSYEPHLTFILNTQDKSLGEMKGKGNAKPVAQYHPYILGLLESKYVDKVKGGGYLPVNNFALTDLTPEQREKLGELKPKMGSYAFRLSSEGPTDEFLHDLLESLHSLDPRSSPSMLNDLWDEAVGGFQVKQWPDAGIFVRHLIENKIIDAGDSGAKALSSIYKTMDVIADDIEGGWRYSSVPSIKKLRMLQALSVLSEENLDRLVSYLEILYKTEPPELAKASNTDKKSRDVAIVEFILNNYRNGPDYPILLQAWSSAATTSTLKRMNDVLKPALDEYMKIPGNYGTITRWGVSNYGAEYTPPIKTYVPLSAVVQTVDEQSEVNPLSEWAAQLLPHTTMDLSALADFDPNPHGTFALDAGVVNRIVEVEVYRYLRDDESQDWGSVQGSMEKVAYNYNEMFAAYLKDFPEMANQMSSYIAWAKQHLKKRDRIVWFLRYIRLWYMYQLSQSDTIRYKNKAEEYGIRVKEELKRLGWVEDVIYYYPNNLETILDHYLSLPIPEIQNTVWAKQTPGQLDDAFNELEKKWKLETGGGLKPQPGDKPIITFGDGWAWWLLDRGYCPEEAKAMGHCGNVNGQYRPEERILSLRKSVNKGGKESGEPHLTFILNTSNQSLGEMKGRGNEKPASRYHPYILALLESKYVVKVVGGGYRPQNNFKLSDLTPEQREELGKKKPQMRTFAYRYASGGPSGQFMEDLIEALVGDGHSNTRDLYEKWDEETGGFEMYEWWTIESFLIFLLRYGVITNPNPGIREILENVDEFAQSKSGLKDNKYSGKILPRIFQTLSALSKENLSKYVSYLKKKHDISLPIANPSTISDYLVKDGLDHELYILLGVWSGGLSAHVREQCQEITKPSVSRYVELTGKFGFRIKWETPEPGDYTPSIQGILPIESVIQALDRGDTEIPINTFVGDLLPPTTMDLSRLNDLTLSDDIIDPVAVNQGMQNAYGYYFDGGKVSSNDHGTAMQGSMEKIAYDYMEMFNGYLKDFPKYRHWADERINWAKVHLKKRDRITWYLRLYRLKIYTYVPLMSDAELIAGGVAPENIELVREKYAQVSKDEFRRLGWPITAYNGELYSTRSLDERLAHILSLPIPEIQNTVWEKQTPNQLIGRFVELENKWKEETKGFTFVQPGDKPIITFGDGWAWWLLDRGYCPEEAKAMGHCGNINGKSRSEERILSLRKSIKRGNGEFLEPHLTFILNTEDHSLGEMKGKGNQKPAPQYHPYILKLLLDPLIKKVKGGGYLPENNFKLSDLSEELMNELQAAKPEMAGWSIRFKKEGLTPEFIRDANEVMGLPEFKEEFGGWAFNWWGGVDEFVSAKGNDRAKWCAKVFKGEEWLDIEPYDHDENMLQTLEAASPESLTIVWNALIENHPRQVISWLETDSDIDVNKLGKANLARVDKYLRALPLPKVAEIVSIIYTQNLIDIKWKILRAWTRGAQIGTENNMAAIFDKDLDAALANPTSYGTTLRRASSDWDATIYEIVPISLAIQALDNGVDEVSDWLSERGYDPWNTFLEIDEPYSGFDGWDGENVDEDIQEEFYEAPAKPVAKNKKPPKVKKPKTGAPMEKIAYDYTEMFRGLLSDYDYFKKRVEEEINWAKVHLKKRDRITLWLKWIRIIMYYHIASGLFIHTPGNGPTSEEEALQLQLQEKYTKLFTTEAQRMGTDRTMVGQLNKHHIENYKRVFDHYLSLPIPEIQNIVWTNQKLNNLSVEMRGYEEIWEKETKGALAPHPGDKPIITFGDGWAWWLLDRGYCPEEAKAMGHCGNVNGQYNDDERILSLRKSVKRGKLDYYEPHLTFILHQSDKSLGEMKGRANEKPTVAYHPYIIKLLESPYVDIVKGGGYKPENNFRLADLPLDVQERLGELKPQMASWSLRLRKEGRSPQLIKDLETAMGYGKNTYHQEYDGFAINTWSSVKDLVEEHGNDDAKYALTVLDGDNYFEVDPYNERENMEEALDACKPETLKKVLTHIRENYPDEVLSWLVDNSEEDKAEKMQSATPAKQQRYLAKVKFDTGDIANLVEDQNLDDVRLNILRGWMTGSQTGAQNEMYESFRRAYDQILDSTTSLGTTIKGSKEHMWDNAIYEILPLEKAIAIIESGEANVDDGDIDISAYFEYNRTHEDEFVFDVSQPHYGWSGWDKEAVDESISSDFYEPPPTIPEPTTPAQPPGEVGF